MILGFRNRRGKKMSDVFYLSLPSTASSRIYPDNTPIKFKVKLAKEIYLPESEWEVALSSISFPSTSDTVIHKNVNYQKLAEVDFLCGMELDMKGVKNYTAAHFCCKSSFLFFKRNKYPMTINASGDLILSFFFWQYREREREKP